MATIIEMPKLSDTMSVGTLISWLKKEGEKVASGDKIAEVETDKATMEMEIFDDGVLLKQFAAAGDQVAVGDPICAIGEKGEKVEAPAKKEAPPAEKSEARDKKTEQVEDKKAPASKPDEAPKEKPKAADTPGENKGAVSPPRTPSDSAPAPRASGERIRISPLARKLAEEKGIDPANIEGTGPNGRIVKADVEAAAKAPKAPAAASGGMPSANAASAETKPPFVGTAAAGVQEEGSLPISNMRGAIARRLVESKTQIPHFYLEIDVDAGPLMKLRKEVNEAFGEGSKVSINDFVIKACAHALRQVPEVNRSWEGESIKAHAGAHISFAVAIEDGLVTPVIFDAQAKSVFEIAGEARTLGGKAKARKLQPAEFTGGTFCVSNLGMFGIPRFTAIINPPNAAILAVGATEKKPVVNEKGEIVVGEQMSLTLACDHRVVDGATGARYLAAVRDILEKPLLVLG